MAMTDNETTALLPGPGTARAGPPWAWDGVARSLTPIRIGPEAAGSIRGAVRRLLGLHPAADLDDARLLVDAEAVVRSLPEDLVATLVDFRVHGSHDGALLVRGLPLDGPLPPTPSPGTAGPGWGELPVASAVQLMLMSVLGDVIAYADEKDGRLLQDICPARGAEDRQENTGSCLLELHTEDGFHPNRPDFLGLLCLRPDHDGQALTVASSVRAALPGLAPDVREALRRPWFRVRLSSSFTGPGPVLAVYSDPAPALSGADDDPDLCVDFHATEPLNSRAAAALESLRSAMLAELVGVALEPGDLLLVDNRKAVHGRTSFRPRYDGRDRWLRRCFVVTDIRNSSPLRYPGSRVHRPIVPPSEENS
jgi:L-asparagine oxygenase